MKDIKFITQNKKDPYNLICKFKTEEICLKDFKGDRNLLQFFQNIRDGEIGLKKKEK